MRSTEFLREESELDVECQQFLKNCSVFLQNNTNVLTNVLYRGDKKRPRTDNFMINERSVTEGRRPVDVDEVIHSIVNELFSEVHTYPFRSGMMCNGSRIQAADYGPTYIIVPCDGYEICYSPVYKDFYENIRDEVLEKLSYINDDGYEDNQQRKALMQLTVLVRKIFKDGRYISGVKNTDAAIGSKHEVMLYPSDFSTLQYYAFTEQFWHQTMVPMLQKRMI